MGNAWEVIANELKFELAAVIEDDDKRRHVIQTVQRLCTAVIEQMSADVLAAVREVRFEGKDQWPR